MFKILMSLVLLCGFSVSASTVYSGYNTGISSIPHKYTAENTVKVTASGGATNRFFLQSDGQVISGVDGSVVALPAPVIDISSGISDSLFLTDSSDSNKVYSINVYSSGALVNITYVGGTPVTGVRAVFANRSALEASSIALLNDGTAVTWPISAVGYQNAVTIKTFITGPAVQGIKSISISSHLSTPLSKYSVLILKTDGTVWSYGDNTYGQLGDGTTDMSNYPVQVKNSEGTGPFIDAVQVSAGEKYSLILKSDGSVYGCGDISYTYYSTKKMLPVHLLVTNVVGISAMGTNASYILGDGTLWNAVNWWSAPVRICEFIKEPIIQALVIPNGSSMVLAGSTRTITADSIAPNTGSASGGESVTVTGTGFTTQATAVAFDDVQATDVVVVNSTTITCKTPVHVTGVAAVKVVQPGAFATKASAFLFTQAAGPQGLKGDTGNTGAQGVAGQKGDTGAQGPKGDKGERGDNGPKGDQGDKGEDGSYITTSVAITSATSDAPVGTVIQLIEGVDPPAGYVFTGMSKVNVINAGRKSRLTINYYVKQ